MKKFIKNSSICRFTYLLFNYFFLENRKDFKYILRNKTFCVMFDCLEIGQYTIGSGKSGLACRKHADSFIDAIFSNPKVWTEAMSKLKPVGRVY